MDLKRIAGLDACSRGEGLADDTFFGVVMEPATVNVPPGIDLIHSGRVAARVWKGHGAVRPSSHECGFDGSRVRCGRDISKNFGGNFHYWCKADDIVAPKNCFDFAQVLLGKVRAGVHR